MSAYDPKRTFLATRNMPLRTLALVVVVLLVASGSSLSFAAEPVPNTLEEAFSALDNQLPSSERESFKNMPERQAVRRAHMGLGMYIRNDWFRRGGSALPQLLQARHLDDASSIVLTSYWRYLNGRPLDVEQQIACYHRWWAVQQRLREEANRKGSRSYPSPSFSCPAG
jgi:hypothetical protein